MYRIAGFLMFVGFVSAILHFTSVQLKILIWSEPLQPLLGLGLGALGVVFLLIAKATDSSPKSTNVYPQQAAPGEPYPGQVPHPGQPYPGQVPHPAGYQQQVQGYAQPTPAPGFAQPAPGYAQPGYAPPAAGYAPQDPAPQYQTPQYPQNGYPQPGYPQPGYPQAQPYPPQNYGPQR
jgi:hypothetical protein